MRENIPSGQLSGNILVIGGGIAGLSAALEASEAGYDVYVVERNPYLGGRVAQLYKYFPKLCPPYCGLEILFRRIRTNPKIKFLTMSEVVDVSGSPGNFDVTVRIKPRYVDISKCTACGECAKVCPVERDNDFNYGMDKTKAIYLPHDLAFPMKYVIDDSVCKKDECAKCVSACKYDAIDFSMEEKTINIKAESIIVATGWKPYDATKLTNLGFGKYPNVITNVMMERLASYNGPTKGKIVRPSDGKEPNTIAFVQCAGSRDENHLPYCSAICCLASMKQATYIREQYPDAKVYIFYIDIRAPGRFEDFYATVSEDENIVFVKGKVAKIEEGENGNLIVVAENTLTGEKTRTEVEMVVLATGMQPELSGVNLPIKELKLDSYGFALSSPGIYVAGVAKKPSDVATAVEESTAAALKGIQIAKR
ncbi:putative adenylylsulfate reductase-associated electron transfer protein QmoA [Archaeoglobus sulfaticallidus PM70-1]|uniref:CoB--CoM heterodisulfide reductase iron-sulfur subunit A n=1 Tax=Archaeoglobus sulfaticallidus PM70-1 TaxID=387631 RepID=N0BGF3_9EURY|nr:CoB--CoM heterodisulfide reductase iron-sulfur subunit A family protein [Archaeoglobus sulfaticallidus]AGK62068.1 putative adenylylsulfate reductase-associated electron transfer protein QmoA [Archaeoglobus sulfaticallidus PM70-1]